MDNIREKLVELQKEAIREFVDLVSDVPLTDFVADHLVAHGVTVLPCKLGDTAWGIKRCNLGNVVKQGEVYQMYFGEDMRLCICVKNVCCGEWGVNVFGTKEEAEGAVGKMAKKEE